LPKYNADLIAYSPTGLVLVLEYVEYALKVVLLVLHGLQDEFQKFLIDVLHDTVEVRVIRVRVGQHHLDYPWELLLEDLFNEFTGGALRDGLSGLAFLR
jgi:hypothetical protein